MNHQLDRHKIADGVFFSSISSPKFKHNRLSVHCIMPLSENTASVNALVPMMLCRGSKNQPDFSKLNAQLNNLYGASLSTRISRFNRYQTVGLSVSTLDNRYALEGENLVQQATELLAELFFQPNLDESGAFDSSILELEKQSLIDAIESEINDKRSYAITRAMKSMFEGEEISTPRLGSVEATKAITPLSAADAWRNIVKNAPIEIIFSGFGDPEPAMQLLAKAFSSLERTPHDYSIVDIRNKADKVTEIVETIDDLQQGKLVMGMRCAGINTLEDEDAARIFSAIYGGTPFSKLFLNVREKLSLAYYCAARMDVTNNFLLIDSGVETENKEKAQDEILHQLKLMQDGEITEEELVNTKLLLTNSLQNVDDSLSSLEGWYLSQILRGTDISPQQDIKNLALVTVEDVTRIANSLSLDTVYFLTGKEAE